MGELDPYILEIVRYLHLNPLRAGAVADLRALARYPYTGHATLCGTFFDYEVPEGSESRAAITSRA